MISILFFIKRKKLLKDGTAPIYIRVTVKKVVAEFASGKSINPSVWLSQKGRAKGNILNNKQLNSYSDQQEYLLHDRHNNNNTTVKYLRNIGKVLHMAVSRGIITASPMQQLQLKTVEVEKEYLTAEELNKLSQTNFSIERLELVKNIFLFCCYTGLAYIDVSTLSSNDITKSNDGESWIKKARNKTNSMCHIPILTPAKAILEKYSTQRVRARVSQKSF